MERIDLTLDLRESVLDGVRLTTPVADTPAGWVCMGIGDDLDEAAAEAMNAMLDLLGARYRLGRTEALALASVVVDLRVTQVANQVFGVHAVLPARRGTRGSSLRRVRVGPRPRGGCR